VPRVPIQLQPLPSLVPYHQPVIAEGKVRYVGEPIAVMLADSAAIAEDALDAIRVDIEPLPPVVDRHAAARGEALLFEETGTNLAIKYTAVKGDMGSAWARADYVRRERFAVRRHTAITMEPRGLLSEWDAAHGRLTVSGASKVPFFNRRILAAQMGLAEDAIDMVENDVGGGFGVRGEFYPEDFLIPFAARFTGRPVKWIEGPARAFDRRKRCARGRMRAANRLPLRRHDPRPKRRRLCRCRRLQPDQWHGRRPQHRSVPVRPLPHSRYTRRSFAVIDQQNPGRHLSRTRTVRGRFLSRAALRHRRP
jgi:hypothetical protein